MAILSILDLMCKKFLLPLIMVTFLFVTVAGAQSGDDTEETADPDASGVPMPLDGVLIENLPIEDIIEGVGTILANGVYFREKPSERAKQSRISVRGEKVLILGVSENWLRVRMYNNQEAYINKKYVKMEKVYKDEALIGSVDKKLYLELSDIIVRFNSIMSSSSYASKFHIFPYIKLLDSKKSKDYLTITLLYSSMNTEGKIVPSLQANLLKKNMLSFLELLFSKLLLADIAVSDIIINTPKFSANGQVLDNNNFYAKLTLKKADVNLKEVNATVSNIWKYVDSSIPKEKLFDKYPTN